MQAGEVSALVHDPVLHWLAAGALALLFAVAGLGKWRDLRGFAGVLAAYELLPVHAVRATAFLLAGGELVLAAALCVPALWPYAGAAAFALLGLYTAAIAANLLRGRTDMDCGCLGAARQARGGAVLSGWLLLRNAAVLLLPPVLWLPVSARALALVDAGMVAAGVLALALAYRVADELIANQIELRLWLDGDA